MSNMDFAVTTEGLRETASNVSKEQTNLQNAIDATDAEVLKAAETAFGANSDEYIAFKAKYEAEMKVLSQELSDSIADQAGKANTTADRASDMIANNLKAIGR